MKLSGLGIHKALMFSFFLLMFVAPAVFPASGASAAPALRQKTFASPEEAVTAFIGAMKARNSKELSVIFGPSISELSSGDEVSDRADREWFIRAYEEKNSLEKKGKDLAILQVGRDDWPLPIPIVKKGSRWFFDTKAGKEEMLNRRIGRNELRVIDVMRGYVDAQREYASRDRDGDGVYPYARKLMSTPGRKDGLYWEAKEGEEESPAGPFVAKAAKEGYTGKAKTDKPSPFHGYYFRILSAQGSHAPGGTYDYVVKGNMVLGFGLVAWPAKYGSSGIMTFIVNQEGVVYQRDLGKNTPKLAKAIKKYDPDKAWQRVEGPAGKPDGPGSELPPILSELQQAVAAELDQASASGPVPPVSETDSPAAALRSLSERAEWKKACSAGDDTGVREMLKTFYSEHPGLYSVQWLDAQGTNRYGYPEENSLINFDMRTSETDSAKPMLQALSDEKESIFDSPLVEGKTGTFFMVPVHEEGEYLGMVYTIRLKE